MINYLEKINQQNGGAPDTPGRGGAVLDGIQEMDDPFSNENLKYFDNTSDVWDSRVVKNYLEKNGLNGYQ